MFRPPVPTRCAFTLVEVLVSLTIVGMAGAALLLASETIHASGADALATMVARGLADQVVDDIVGRPFQEPGTTLGQLPLGPDAGETGLPVQTRLFDDVDDFEGLLQRPPADPWGVPRGTGNGVGGVRPADFQVPASFLETWTLAVRVRYADEASPANDLSGSATSGAKSITVTITRVANGVSQELTRIRRVVSYVPNVGS